jgi:hypothetical protein
MNLYTAKNTMAPEDVCDIDMPEYNTFVAGPQFRRAVMITVLRKDIGILSHAFDEDRSVVVAVLCIVSMASFFALSVCINVLNRYNIHLIESTDGSATWALTLFISSPTLTLYALPMLLASIKWLMYRCNMTLAALRCQHALLRSWVHWTMLMWLLPLTISASRWVLLIFMMGMMCIVLMIAAAICCAYNKLRG